MDETLTFKYSSWDDEEPPEEHAKIKLDIDIELPKINSDLLPK